jgi:hypothetical protein
MRAFELIKSMNDIDILARGSAWEKAKTLAKEVTAPQGDKLIKLETYIDIYNGWMSKNADEIIGRV